MKNLASGKSGDKIAILANSGCQMELNSRPMRPRRARIPPPAQPGMRSSSGVGDFLDFSFFLAEANSSPVWDLPAN